MAAQLASSLSILKAHAIMFSESQKLYGLEDLPIWADNI